jgi:hypothetical protein
MGPRAQPPDRHIKIDDRELIKWFKENYTNIKFLNFRVHKRIPAQNKRIKKDIEKLNIKIPLHRQKDLLLKIWENLIGSSIVFLKSRDKREKFHEDEDYGVEKLSEFFKAFSDFESLFYGADEFYRDHVIHMFNVFLLGQFLLTEKKLFNEIKIEEVFGKKLLDDIYIISNEEKEAIWCIISLTHDLGYGMGKIPKINNKTRKMLDKFDIFNIQELGFTFPNQPLYKFVIEFISSDLREITCDSDASENRKENRRKYINHIQSKYFLKYSSSFERFGHGIFSCILLMKNLIYFLESDFSRDTLKPLNQYDARNFLIRQTILRSIASHDCEDIYYLTLPQFPFLLTIFDEMQDWGRPGLSDLFTYKPHKQIFIEKLNESEIFYREEYSDPNSQIEEDERVEIIKFIFEDFKRKCKKFKKILRSAVGGDLRKLILRFESVDIISQPNRKYSITHKSPKEVIISIDGQNYNWNQFIEREERLRPKPI